jgi:hypothetical protein
MRKGGHNGRLFLAGLFSMLAGSFGGPCTPEAAKLMLTTT